MAKILRQNKKRIIVHHCFGCPLHEKVPYPEGSALRKAEGIVIKRYRKKGEYMRAKIVKPEFIKVLEESVHWTHGPIKNNKLEE